MVGDIIPPLDVIASCSLVISSHISLRQLPSLNALDCSDSMLTFVLLLTWKILTLNQHTYHYVL